MTIVLSLYIPACFKVRVFRDKDDSHLNHFFWIIMTPKLCEWDKLGDSKFKRSKHPFTIPPPLYAYEGTHKKATFFFIVPLPDFLRIVHFPKYLVVPYS